MFSSRIAVVAVLCATSLASAQISYTAQSRFIRTAGGITAGQSNTTSAPNFGPFSASRTDFYVNEPGEPPMFNSRGSATQNSTLNPNQISMSGEVSGTDNYGSGGAGFGAGTSSLDVFFALNDVNPYRFRGSFNSGYNSASDYSLILERTSPSPAVLFQRTLSGSFSDPTQAAGPFDVIGNLSAGNYRLRLSFTDGYGGFGTGSGSASHTVLLFIPAPGAVALAGFGGLALLRRRR
jgi:uncharacterized protein (TIGR03382 family)